jgi:hypothetical protein
MAEQLGELAARLRRPALDVEDEEGLEELAVGGWLDRASWALERLEAEELGSRLAAELLITWQALARMADDAPHADDRAALYAGLDAVCARGAELVVLGAGAFAFEAWGMALAAYDAEVGVPTSWDAETAERARVLIEGLDDALLFEAAAEALGVALDEATAEALQRCAIAGGEAAHSLVPAQVFIRAVAATLNPSMEEASGTYPLWLELMEAREAWAVGEVVVRAAVASHERGAQAPQAAVIDFAAAQARKQAALGQREPAANERLEAVAPRVLLAADDGGVADGERREWRGESGWSASLRLPTARTADEAVVRLFVEELPCAGVVFLMGIGRLVAADAPPVEFTAGELREAEVGGFALVFVGDDGRVEVGVLDE